MVQADVIVSEISCQQKFFFSCTFFRVKLKIKLLLMASNHPTFELGFLDDFEDLKNVSEMVAKTSEASKDQQSESATSENNHFAKFIRAGLENT